MEWAYAYLTFQRSARIVVQAPCKLPQASDVRLEAVSSKEEGEDEEESTMSVAG
jgi:hypothetical protein